jgi:hypothetical protein
MLTSKFVKPVTLLDGRAKFVTTPLITGSLNNTNTIGIVLVARCNASVDKPLADLLDMQDEINPAGTDGRY